ncbi:MAG: type II toxin-antitoxin system Phd/YefM family antitoxin [Opitutales bacterium]|nr:type II toxin-antitoxin system Phd/YefM family antitoxin [Opitutales bacterium]
MKTGNLRNNLSRYLKRVRQTGETIVVLDREEPVAELRPYGGTVAEVAKDVWSQRERHIREKGGWTEDFELPTRRTHAHKHDNPLD